ncbi:BQ5605_C008g05051 [Microbotryum silenes-dioicae]|uniref:Exocyst complex component Sec8 n=1 Tax=Microbotryum silenes-dioicae TaxID=796604 RepID=A0A2X0MGP9_9BASI|nr:BQ5605_C008g05051 [Microbotryum silenes-dioicae]
MSRQPNSRLPPSHTSGASSPSSFHSPESPGRYGDEHAPSRPERSTRRPLGSTSSPSGFAAMSDGRFPDQDNSRRPSGAGPYRAGPSGLNNVHGGSFGGGPYDMNSSHVMVRSGSNQSNGGYDEGGSGNGAVTNKSSRMMDQLRKGSPSSPVIKSSSSRPHSQKDGLHPSSASNTRATPSPAFRRDSMSSDGGSSTSSRSRSPRQGDDGEEVVGVMGVTEPTMALTSAVSAFSSAGQRRDGRRGGLADQGFDAADADEKGVKVHSTALDPNEYPDTPAFREVEAVLRKVVQEWPVMTLGTSLEAGGRQAEEFDPVSLALGLLDPSNHGTDNSLSSFLRMKDDLDHAIMATLSDGDAASTSSYRAFETSISTHNSTVQSLTANQKQIVDLRKSLVDAREMLEGKGREGLFGLYNRMSHLEEMLKLLDEIDHFRSIPDRLELLLSEKRFLSAVVLLVRSLKTISKPEMMEIGALTDLRSWLVLQEGVMLEILIEELHNHLYLKSFYCDVRWKPYSRGQTSLPVVDFGEDVETAGAPSHLEPSFHSSGRSTARLPRLTKLHRYLNYLSLRPSINPLLDEPIDDIHDSLSPTADDGSVGLDGTGIPLGGDKFESSGDKQRPKKNLELDSFAYIEMLMECLACLGKLGYGLDAISQRVQGEMFQLVETTVEEVDERNDSTKQASMIAGVNRPQSLFSPTSASTGMNLQEQRGPLASLSSLSLPNGVRNRTSSLRLTASETTALESNVETLKDFFWTLYSKLDAVLQGFRVAYEVSLRITERRDFKDSAIVKSSSGNLLFSLMDIWKPVQQEVRSLLHDYLTDDQSGTVSSRNPIVSVNEVLRLARPRDYRKQIFKFADSDLKASSKALKIHEEELNRTLKLVLPGLMTDGANFSQSSGITLGSDDRYGAGGARSGLAGTHKALVSADAFNVSVLFGPTLSFLSRVREVMPGGLVADHDGAGGFGGFLDDFVVRTFLPQLEEKVTHVFHQAVGGLDAFQEDPNYKKVSRVPIVKSVSNLMMLITSLTSMLQATPFHRESYSHLIISVIHQFYQRCNERFKDLTARENHESAAGSNSKAMQLKTSANWASLPELNATLADLHAAMPGNTEAASAALRRETKIELDKKRNSLVNSEDLITPSKKLMALGTLYSSLDCFIAHISALKHVTDRPNGSTLGDDTSPSSPVLDQSDDGHSPTRPFSLPLTSEMSKPFDSLLKSYRQLANLVLFTLRLEIRLRTIHYLDKATRDGVYQLAEDIAEPDPSVVDLNSDLAECDECAATTLAEPERKFIFEGLSLLMDQLLISNARHIRLANQFGLKKMFRNILALQQNLKNLGDAPLQVNFDRSRKFWDVFGRGPKEMLDAIREGTIKYDFEDYKALLNLMCGVDQSSKDGTTMGLMGGAGAGSGTGPDGAPLSASGGDRSRRMYNEYLIDLFALDVGE